VPGDEEVLRALYAAWNEGGARAASEYWAEDVVVHDFPELPDAGVFHGREETVRAWEERLTTFDIKLEPASIEEIGPGRFLIVLEVSTEGADTGIHLTETHYHLIVMRDGVATEAHFFRDAGQARAAAGLPDA
jgi:ketosteroid isomerase-like protein